MNPEYRVRAAQIVIEPPEHKNANPEESTFTLNFNLDGIDESFFFNEEQITSDVDDTIPEPEVEKMEENQKKPLEPDKQSTLFSEWLASTIPDENLDTELPKVFQHAEKKGQKVANQLKGVSAAGLGSVGSVFSSLSAIIGACGPICAHTLGALGNAGSSIGSVGAGINMPGFSVDKNGNFSLSGNVDSLANNLDISKSDLLSGKYSAQDILYRLFSTFGESISLIFGFGLFEMLIDCMFDCFLPNSSDMGELSSAA